MRPRVVVVRQVLGQDATQSRLSHDDHMIRALTSDRSNHALGVRVLPRGTWCRAHLLDAHTLGCGSDGRERAVPIVEEIPRGMILGEGLAELLRGPGSRGMRGHRDVHDAPPIVRQDDRATNRSRYVMVGTTKKSAAIIWVT